VDVDSLFSTFTNRPVLVTGHTGFKGSWLVTWLHRLGANVTGLALDPPTSPSAFAAARVAELLIEDVRGDIRDGDLVAEVVHRSGADVIFHLAAQPIVRTSLADPRTTFDVNVLGTVSLLDAVRRAGRPCAVVVVTSDKCYRNEGQPWGLREIDPLGGHDPYSASKAATELVVDAYRHSFFDRGPLGAGAVRLASVRAGNVIGGGDWAPDRLVPDAVRALSSGSDLILRNPASTRPWQHVLEPLSGYLELAARMLSEPDEPRWSASWNFGPLVTDEATVAEVATALVDCWGEGAWRAQSNAQPLDVEANFLRIAIDKAVGELGWRPRWRLTEAVRRTADWYRAFYETPHRSMGPRTLADIEAYEAVTL
jgi:CDP-glucose 4,6-dehydratase